MEKQLSLLPIDAFLQIPSIFNRFDQVLAGQSKRHGGVSLFPYESLNLGLHTDDLIANVWENRKRFFEALGFEEKATAGGHQVHGVEVLEVKTPGQYEGYDAFICNQKNILLTVTIADCVPVLIYDSKNEAIAAIHAGWKGTSGRIVQMALKEMAKCFNTHPEDCLAFIGTCIDECSFEVDEDVAQFFADGFKRWDESKQKFFIDLKAANRQQLQDAGVPLPQIEISPYSTVLHNHDFFSYRKEKGKTGRMLAVIGMN